MSWLFPKTATQKLFCRIPTLYTPRLTLRRLVPADAQDMFEYARLNQVTRYLTWYEHDSADYTLEYLTALQRAYRRGEFFDWGIELTEEKKMIGTCGFTSIREQDNTGEIGYVLNPRYQGRGLMTEAVQEVVRFGFETLCLERIEARHMDGNESSARVMKRCGLQYEGRLRHSLYVKGEYRNICWYSILKSEYEKQKNT